MNCPTESDFVARFLREADIVSRLSHRNIVSIYDRGDENGQLWLTMRYVDGIDVEAALAQAGGILPARRAVHIISEVASALDAAHRLHLIHRDVKPANILLSSSDDDDDEQVFLTDFGIAKSLDAGGRLTRTGLVVATFDYASPEQIEARPLDASSDIYSLTCVLYKLLTGSVPFPGETMLAPAAGHLSLPPPRADRPRAVAGAGSGRRDRPGHGEEPGRPLPSCRALAAAAVKAMDDFPNAPSPPYRVFMSRSAEGTGSGAHVGPVRTDVLGVHDTDAAGRAGPPHPVLRPARTRRRARAVRAAPQDTDRRDRVLRADAPGRSPTSTRPAVPRSSRSSPRRSSSSPAGPAAAAVAAAPPAPPTQRSTPPLPVEQGRSDTPVAPISRILKPPPPPPAASSGSRRLGPPSRPARPW